MDQTFVIEGRKDTDAVFPRLNVLDLQRDTKYKEQWTLFILALLAIQYPDESLPVKFVPSSLKASDIVPKGGLWYELGRLPIYHCFCSNNVSRRRPRQTIWTLPVSYDIIVFRTSMVS